MKPNYLVKSQHRVIRDEYSYLLCTFKPKTEHMETLDYNIQVFNVPADLNLAQAIKYVEIANGT